MKKILVATILLLGTVTVQAEYRMFVGLTESHNGAIPENGITFKNKTTPPVEPPKPTIECKLEDGVYSWRTTAPGSAQGIFWAGEALRSHIAQLMDTEFVWNGYKYTRGETLTVAGPKLWSICRISILL
jgi:hypothetical protein